MSNCDLLELNRQVIKGTSNGKIIWQPRIICYFDDREFRKEPFDKPYTGMNRYDIYREIGCSDRTYQFGASIQPVYDESIKMYYKEIDNMSYELKIETPIGILISIQKKNTSNPGIYPQKWYVTTEEDLKTLIYLEDATTYIFNKSLYDSMFENYGDLGLPAIYIPRVNIQKLFHEYMGIEGTLYALQDYPDTVEAVFEAMGRNQDKYMDVLLDTPFEWINYGDNIHCNLLPPELFKKYVLPEYQHRNERLHEKGLFTYSHWDGDVKTLLPYAKETGLDGIEAITPFPQGDVSLKETKKHLGDMCLIDGLAALLFNDDYPLQELKDQVNECIELFAPNLILGISDEMPSTGNIERVKVVQEMVEDYNSRV